MAFVHRVRGLYIGEVMIRCPISEKLSAKLLSLMEAIRGGPHPKMEYW